jgi:DNA processing protein
MIVMPPEAVEGFELVVNSLIAGRSVLIKHVMEEIEVMLKTGLEAVVIGDTRYPSYLKHINDPPLAIFVAGSTAAFDRPMVAIVGSRNASSKALHHAFHLARELANNGFTIVSGGAFGCDTMAHEGALSSENGCTVVVQAGGLGRLYPRSNLGLFRRTLAMGGAVITERLWARQCRPYDFPVRNRLVAGMVDQVVIAEARQRSGAISTANLAAGQGRDVLVLDFGESNADGSRALINDGAEGRATYQELLELLLTGRRCIAPRLNESPL